MAHAKTAVAAVGDRVIHGLVRGAFGFGAWIGAGNLALWDASPEGWGCQAAWPLILLNVNGLRSAAAAGDAPTVRKVVSSALGPCLGPAITCLVRDMNTDRLPCFPGVVNALVSESPGPVVDAALESNRFLGPPIMDRVLSDPVCLDLLARRSRYCGDRWIWKSHMKGPMALILAADDVPALKALATYVSTTFGADLLEGFGEAQFIDACAAAGSTRVLAAVEIAALPQCPDPHKPPYRLALPK
jgi:hypothetical protein